MAKVCKLFIGEFVATANQGSLHSKRNIRIHALTVLTCIVVSLLPAQWVNVSGLYNPYVTALAVSGTTVLAGSGTSVFKSIDGGKHWWQPSSIYGTQLDKSIACMTSVADGSGDTTVYACTSDGWVFLSTDAGTTWTEGGYVNPNPVIRSVAVKGEDLFVGNNFHVFHSTDNGSSWVASDSGRVVKPVVALTFAGPYLLAGTIGAGIFRTSDSGMSWVAADSNMADTAAYCFVIDDTIIYAGTNTGVFRSSDYGTHWNRTSSGLPDTSILCLQNAMGSVYAGTPLGLFRSTDSGMSWAESDSGMPKTAVTAFAAENAILFAGTQMAGVWVSSDFGVHWMTDSSLSSPYVYSLSSVNGNLYASTQKKLFVSRDGGIDWGPISGNMIDTTVIGPILVGTHLFLGSQGDGVLSSANDGESWSRVDSGLGSENISSIATNDTDIFVGISPGVFRSTDNGLSWALANTGRYQATGVVALDGIGTDLFAGTSSGGLIHTTDMGVTWKQILLPGAVTYVYYFFVVDTSLYADTDAGTFLVGHGHGEWRSATYQARVAVSGHNLFSNWAGGLRVSTDNGTTWTNFRAASDPRHVTCLTIVDSMLYVATGLGVWRRPLSEIIVTGVRTQVATIPLTTSLSQNYPNPFNPSTTIKYQLPKSGYVSLKVYDVLGRFITTIAEGVKIAGFHSATFDGSRLSSGVYVTRFIARPIDGGKQIVQTKKIVLLK